MLNQETDLIGEESASLLKEKLEEKNIIKDENGCLKNQT